MKLVREGERWILHSRFEERAVPKAAGFRWDGARKVWYSDDAAIAAKLAGYCGDAADKDVLLRAAGEAVARELRAQELRERSLAMSVAAEADVVIPAPEGREYRPFQRAGIAYAALRANTLIGDDMGLGKTIQALGLVNSDPSLRRVLVVCPASLKINWAREAVRWLVRPARVVVLDSKSPAYLFESIEREDDVVAILNYDVVEKLRPRLDAIAWDLLVLDEVHYAKNPKALRSQAIWGRKASAHKAALAPLAASAKRRLALTGTPILNRPIEMWNLIHAFDPKGLGKSWFEFANRYCAAERTRYGYDVSGSANLDELQARLRGSFMVRRLKADVLKELPPKQRQVIELPVNGAAELVERERRAYERHQNVLAELRAAVAVAEISDDEEAHRAAIKALQAGNAAAFAEMSRLRHEVGLAKVPHVVEHVHDAVEGSGAVVVFCHHKDVLYQIEEALDGRKLRVATLTGEDPLDVRQAAVDAFQRGEKDIILITIGAGREGLTLTRSAHVIFAELDWVPAYLSQAEDRCHRIGQTDTVLVQHLVLEGSLDAYMAQTLIGKQEVIDAALNGGGKLPEAEPAQDPVQAAIAALPEPQVDQARQAKIKAEREAAALVSDEERELIHGCLQQIAAYCDGAAKEDGMGFNKIDTVFGKRLAAQAQLVGRQVIYARKLVVKYGRQIHPEALARVKAIEIKVQEVKP